MKLSSRQEKISQIVKEFGPITGNAIAERLSVTRAALRSDLAILTMMGVLDARPKVGYFYIGEAIEDPVVSKLKGIKISEVLSQAAAVSPSTSLYDTIVMMFTEDVGTLLICENGFLQGIVSRKDLLRASIGQSDPTTMPISMIMTPASKVICLTPNDLAVEAAQKMIDFEIDCLPVVEKFDGEDRRKYKVLGRISKTSITKLFLECSLAKKY